MSGLAAGVHGRSPRGVNARSWVVAIITGSVLFAALVVVVSVLGWRVLMASGPHEHHNPSFHFGESVMRHSVYQGLSGGSVASACREALPHAAHKPAGFDVEEAVAGCTFEEYQLDN